LDSVTKTIDIVSGPAPSFTANDTFRCAAPFTVNFSNTTSGNAVQYTWDFGDGDTSHASTATHTYNNQGSYTVKLTAFGQTGC
jgi:PKD repeat protein